MKRDGRRCAVSRRAELCCAARLPCRYTARRAQGVSSLHMYSTSVLRTPVHCMHQVHTLQYSMQRQFATGLWLMPGLATTGQRRKCCPGIPERSIATAICQQCRHQARIRRTPCRKCLRLLFIYCTLPASAPWHGLSRNVGRVCTTRPVFTPPGGPGKVGFRRPPAQPSSGDFLHVLP